MLRMAFRTAASVAAVAAALVAATAGAEQLGKGSGKSSVTPPSTKSSGTAAERAQMPSSDPLIEPRHGLLGAPGAALDSAGASRLGAPADRVSTPAAMPDSWRSGDRVRSWTSADVRAARQQQAPDLEWATPPKAAAPATSTRRSTQGNAGDRTEGRER